MILAIDPGNEKSAWVIYEGGDIQAFGMDKNEDILPKFTLAFECGGFSGAEHLAIEMIASYGMAVGQTVFETCVWIGRFIEAWSFAYGRYRTWTKVYRKDVKMHLCHSMRAKDGNIRQAIIDRYPPTGVGKCPQIGTKKYPGPLYGVSKDVWAALGVAITYSEKQKLYEAIQKGT